MRRTVTTFIALICLARSLSAQRVWTVTLERGNTSYSMAAHDTSTPQIRLLPWHPVSYSIRVSRDGPRVGYSLALTTANGQMGATIGNAVILPGSGLILLEVAPEIRHRFATTSFGATLLAHVGPLFDLWAPQGGDVRTTFGAMGGVTLSLPIDRRWGAVIRGDLAVTGSEATRAEESAEIKRPTTMRRGRLALGISRTL